MQGAESSCSECLRECLLRGSIDPHILALGGVNAPPRDAEENRGTTGEFFWDGLPSMLFWVDPVQDMAVVFATQKIDFDGTLHHDIRDAIYGADYTGAK